MPTETKRMVASSEMKTDVLVVAVDAPEDPLHGANLRRWRLLGGGRARVVCLRRRVRGNNGLPLRDRLPWREITEIAPHSTRFPPERNFARMLLETTLAKAGKDTIIFLSHPPSLVEFVAKRVQRSVVVDFCDSHALYHWRRARNLRRSDPLRAGMSILHAVKSLRQEAAIARRADIAITASPADAAILQRFVPDHKLRAIGNGTDWLRRDMPDERACRRARLVFHGGFGWYPNQAALEYFAEAHWPKIRAQVPGVEFHVLGHSMASCLQEMCRREGIVAHGYVKDLFEIVAASGVYVSPMVAGGGVKNKLMEAMAAGVPVVTNRMGAEALPPEARRVVAIHDDPQAFADCVRAIIADTVRWSELRRKSRLVAEHCFDWRHRRAEFEAILAEAVVASEARVRDAAS